MCNVKTDLLYCGHSRRALQQIFQEPKKALLFVLFIQGYTWCHDKTLVWAMSTWRSSWWSVSGLMWSIGLLCLNIIMEIILAVGLPSAHINCLNTDTVIPHLSAPGWCHENIIYHCWAPLFFAAVFYSSAYDSCILWPRTRGNFDIVIGHSWFLYRMCE